MTTEALARSPKRKSRVAPSSHRGETAAAHRPVWNEGFPAILKGFLDRVFIPGVSFTKEPDGAVKPALININKLGTVCTYGAGRLVTMMMGDPPRRVVKRLLRAMTGHHIRCDYLALYGMDRATPKTRTSFLDQVARVFGEW